MMFNLLLIIFILLIILNYGNTKNILTEKFSQYLLLDGLSISNYFNNTPIDYNFDWIKKESIINDNYYMKNDNYGYIKDLFNDKVKLNYMSAEEYYNKTSKK